MFIAARADLNARRRPLCRGDWRTSLPERGYDEQAPADAAQRWAGGFARPPRE